MTNGPAVEGQAAVAEEDQAPTTERKVAEKLNEAQKRLKQLVEVNRKLHSTLAEKKIRSRDLRKSNEELMRKLEAREVEEMGRHRQLQDLQMKLQGEQTSQQAETLSLQKSVLSLEERIEHLNEENLALGDRHKESKALIAEQQNAMKLLQRRSKDLARHIEFMAGHLNEAQMTQLGGPGAFRKDDDSASSVAGGAGDPKKLQDSRPKTIVDFQRLPGLDLNKLLGEEAMDGPGRNSSPDSKTKSSGTRKKTPTNKSETRPTGPSNEIKETNRATPSNEIPEVAPRQQSGSDLGSGQPPPPADFGEKGGNPTSEAPRVGNAEGMMEAVLGKGNKESRSRGDSGAAEARTDPDLGLPAGAGSKAESEAPTSSAVD